MPNVQSTSNSIQDGTYQPTNKQKHAYQKTSKTTLRLYTCLPIDAFQWQLGVVLFLHISQRTKKSDPCCLSSVLKVVLCCTLCSNVKISRTSNFINFFLRLGMQLICDVLKTNFWMTALWCSKSSQVRVVQIAKDWGEKKSISILREHDIGVGQWTASLFHIPR